MFIDCHLPPSYCMTVDLPDNIYSFPHHITPTNLRPDVVWWSDEMKMVYFLELTISFESTMDQAHHRKLAKYNDLLEAARMAGYNAECLTLEVGSRGLVIDRSAPRLKKTQGLVHRCHNWPFWIDLGYGVPGTSLWCKWCLFFLSLSLNFLLINLF